MKKIKFPNLIYEMNLRNDTRKDIAKLLNLSRTSVDRRFSGKTRWQMEDIDLICNRYHRSYYYLFHKF